MGNALTRKFNGEGYTELAAACGEIKKWAEENSLGDVGKLKYSVSATISEPAIGQGKLFDSEETDSAPSAEVRKRRAAKRKKAKEQS